MEEKIAIDLKAAMIAKDALRVSVLRSLKSAFTYAKVAPKTTIGKNGDDKLDDGALTALIAKEAKKRQESADSFVAAGQPDRAESELAEKAIIDAYLPTPLSGEELQQVVDAAIAQLDEGSRNPKAMGQVMSVVKSKAGPSADGSLIARLVKERLSQ